MDRFVASTEGSCHYIEIYRKERGKGSGSTRAYLDDEPERGKR